MAIVVKKQPGESDMRLIDKFKRTVVAEDIVQEVRDRQRYEKPSLEKNKRLSQFRRNKKRRKQKGK